MKEFRVQKELTMHRIHAFAWIFGLVLVSSICACRPTTQPPPGKVVSAATESATTVHDEARPTGPTLTEAQWEEMMYTVIDSIQQRGDVSQAHLEKVTGFALLPTSEGNMDRITRMHGKTREGGSYGISFSDWSEGKGDVTLGVAPPNKPETGYGSRCTYDLARVKGRLRQLGFEGQEHVTRLPYRALWRFTNDRRLIYSRFYLVKLPDGSEQLCLVKMNMGFF